MIAPNQGRREAAGNPTGDTLRQSRRFHQHTTVNADAYLPVPLPLPLALPLPLKPKFIETDGGTPTLTTNPVTSMYGLFAYLSRRAEAELGREPINLPGGWLA
jgi:hypothetical protein